MSYEKNKETLEGVVEKLDQGNLSLKESLALYEKGIKLANECIKELNGLKGQLEILNADLEKQTVDTDVE